MWVLPLPSLPFPAFPRQMLSYETPSRVLTFPPHSSAIPSSPCSAPFRFATRNTRAQTHQLLKVWL